MMQNLTLEIIAIILSIVALFITTIGFFASLSFYRRGVELQNKANNALTRIEEKASSIQSQVGEMFKKMLDAVLKGSSVSQSFEEIKSSLEEAKTKIIEDAVSQVGNAGDEERKRIKLIVDERMKEVSKAVESTQESVKEYVEIPQTELLDPTFLPVMSKIVLANLEREGEWVSFKKLQELMRIEPLKLNYVLNYLLSLHRIFHKKSDDDEYFSVA